MIPTTDTYDAYPVLPVACSFITGHYYFTKHMTDYSRGIPNPNGTILTECKTLKTVVSFSAEAETCGAFDNAQNVIPLQHIIKTFFLHRQPIKG